MSARTDRPPLFPPDAPVAPPRPASPTRPLYWSVRREVWENRSIYAAPLVAATIAFVGFAVSAPFRLPARVRSLGALDLDQQRVVLAAPYNFTASAVIFTAFVVVGVFYCLDALYGERRDRSILFWKSLPVSDLTTVLAKACIPLLVLPAVGYAIALATQFLMLLVSTAVLLLSGVDPAVVWTRLRFAFMAGVMLYGLVAHVLWWAPIFGWLLFVSSWARRAPILWAVLPPLAVGAIEHLVFQTSYVGALVRRRVFGAMTEAFAFDPGTHVITRASQLEPIGFLSTPGLWLGLAVAAGFLVAAARMRRHREPI